MNPLFSVLSAAYIFGIFYWADSSVVSQISAFNPFSLLHIPLYGILTLLLLLAFEADPGTHSRLRNIFPACLAIGVGVLDEFHQSFIPHREASIMDVLLDTLGVVLFMVLARRVSHSLWVRNFKKLKI